MKFVYSSHTFTLTASPNSNEYFSFRDSTAGKLAAYNKLKRRKNTLTFSQIKIKFKSFQRSLKKYQKSKNKMHIK